MGANNMAPEGLTKLSRELYPANSENGGMSIFP
jgi:hypothetical protein